MTSRSLAKKVIWARRVVQAACLFLFLWLLWKARVGAESSGKALAGFFLFDPLVGLATFLAAHEVPKLFLLALVTVAVTVLLGRVFCGWICPLGVVNNVATWFRKLNKAPQVSDRWSRWQRAKYLLLVALLVMACFGAHWIGVFDPLSLLYRSTATGLWAGTQYAAEDSLTAVYQADPHIGPVRATAVTELVYKSLRKYLFVAKRESFHGATVIFLVFIGIVLLNLYRPRFWCRYVCPLGALLGLFAKRPSLRLENKPGCTNCGRCAVRCPAAAEPDKVGQWRATECFGCWNCVAACNCDAITFRFKWPGFSKTGSHEPLTSALDQVPPGPGFGKTGPLPPKLDLSRRALLSAGAAGVTGLVAMRLSPEAQARTFNPSLIRPPGARPEREFLERCIQCGTCMKACPTNALQPTLFEAGLEGIWTPRLVPAVGYCEYNCNFCGQVCPTEAIAPLSLPQKQKTKIGLATFDTTKCLPYAYGRECMVCEEHCPIPTKAIYFVQQEVKTRDGKTIVLKQPRVEPDLCTGCGICENVCVFKDRAAIRCTSANETRHSANQPILPGVAPAPPAGESNASPYG